MFLIPTRNISLHMHQNFHCSHSSKFININRNSHIKIFSDKIYYPTKEYRVNRESFNEYYELVDIYTIPHNTHYKIGNKKRNQATAERSDLVVAYPERDFGGAYQTYRYALKQEKNILKLPIEYYSTKR